MVVGNLIKKIKDRKFEALTTKMSKSSALKVTAKFEDLYKAHKDSGGFVLSEIIHDAFLQNYGLQNVADVKYRRFLTALRVYGSKNAELGKFSQAMGLVKRSKKVEQVII